MLPEAYYIEKTTQTPLISFNFTIGKFYISGRSIPDNATEFYEQAICLLEEYVLQPLDSTEISFNFAYLNTTSSKSILKIIRVLETITTKEKKVQIYWYHEEDDDFMIDVGKDYKGLTKIPFSIISYYDDPNFNLIPNPDQKKISQLIKDVQLRKSTTIDFSGFELMFFPHEILDLEQLEVLKLGGIESKNRIVSLPYSINRLVNLKKLYLQNNLIESLPISLSCLEHLELLDLTNNKLRFISKEILSLKMLKILILSENSIEDIPKDIVQLKKLEVLHLVDNNIRKIPSFLIKVKSLKDFKFFNNPITNMPSDIINSNFEVITDYLKNLKNSRKQIFISYSHSDKHWLGKVQLNLKVLEHLGVKIEVWDDKMIKSGNNWKIEIENALDSSFACILLISTNYLASDFIMNNELPKLLELADEKETIIIPIIISPSLFLEHEILSKFQTLNNPEKPLISMNENEESETLVKLALRVKEILQSNRTELID